MRVCDNRTGRAMRHLAAMETWRPGTRVNVLPPCWRGNALVARSSRKGSKPPASAMCHCEERSDEAIPTTMGIPSRAFREGRKDGKQRLEPRRFRGFGRRLAVKELDTLGIAG